MYLQAPIPWQRLILRAMRGWLLLPDLTMCRQQSLHHFTEYLPRRQLLPSPVPRQRFVPTWNGVQHNWPLQSYEMPGWLLLSRG